MQKVFLAVADRVPGFRGGYVLGRERRRRGGVPRHDPIESLDAARAFAGEDYEVPVIEPEAPRLLSRGDERAEHCEAVIVPE